MILQDFRLLSCTYNVQFRTTSPTGGGSCIHSSAPNSQWCGSLSCPGPHGPVPALGAGEVFLRGEGLWSTGSCPLSPPEGTVALPRGAGHSSAGSGEESQQSSTQNGRSHRVAYGSRTALTLLIAINAAAHIFTTPRDRFRPYGLPSTALHSQSLLCPTQ